jgi:hypothetical protein
MENIGNSKMRKLFVPSLLSALIFAPAVQAGTSGPSAQFAATYGYGPALISAVNITEAMADTSVVLDTHQGYALATIKVPQDKELLIGVSAEVNIVSDISIKGKNGGTATATEGGYARAVVAAVPHGDTPTYNGGPSGVVAEPGLVTLSSRIQALTATLGGVIESCADINGDGTIDVVTECVVSDEQIGLMQDTMSANHFNFILPNMDQGYYDIVVWFLTGASAEVDIDEVSVTNGGSVSGSAAPTALIGKHMVTVQQVRATNDGIINADIVE